MNYPEFFYKLVEFFFNDVYHFLMLALLIYLIRNKRIQIWPSGLFSRILQKYRARISRLDARPKPPPFMQNFDESKVKHPEGADSWRQQ